MPVVLSRVSDAVIEPDELVRAVGGGDAGAICVFLGQIRDHDPEATGEVVAIDYTCHPDAEPMIGEIAAASASGSTPTVRPGLRSCTGWATSRSATSRSRSRCRPVTGASGST